MRRQMIRSACASAIAVTGLAGAACGHAAATTPVALPDARPLAVPPAPPRVVAPPSAAPALAAPPETSAPPPSTTSSTTRPARETKPVTPPAPPAAPPATPTTPPTTTPPPTTPLASTVDPSGLDQRARALAADAKGILDRIDYRALNADARAQYDAARRFLKQVDDALKAKNVTYAAQLAEKANTIATQLQR